MKISSSKQIEYFSIVIAAISIFLFRTTIGDLGLGYMAACLVPFYIFRVLSGYESGNVIGRKMYLAANKGQIGNFVTMKVVFRNLQIVIGFVSSVLYVLLTEKMLSDVFHMPHAYYIPIFLAPALLIRNLNEYLSAYAKGRGVAKATWITDMIRPICILLFGFLFQHFLGEYGTKVSRLLLEEDYSNLYGCLGISIAYVLAEVIVFLYLEFVKWGIKRSPLPESQYGRVRENTWTVLFASVEGRLPEMLNSLAMLMLFLILMIRVSGAGTSNVYGMAGEYGAFICGYLTPVVFAVGLTIVVTCEICLKCCKAFKREVIREVREYFRYGIHVSVIMGSLFSVFLISLSGNLSVLLANENINIGDVLFKGAIVCLLAGPAWFFYRLLVFRGLGLYAFVCNMVACAAGIGIGGIPGSKDIYLGIVVSIIIWLIINCIGLGALTFIRLNLNYDPIAGAIVPFLSCAVIGVFNMIISKMATPHLGGAFTSFICFVAMLTAYPTILLFLRNIDEREIKVLPLSRFLTALGQFLRVL